LFNWCYVSLVVGEGNFYYVRELGHSLTSNIEDLLFGGVVLSLSLSLSIYIYIIYYYNNNNITHSIGIFK